MKPTELDSMNALRVQAERKAALYRRALELACNGDADQVAFFVSEADAVMSEERTADGVPASPAPDLQREAFDLIRRLEGPVNEHPAAVRLREVVRQLAFGVTEVDRG